MDLFAYACLSEDLIDKYIKKHYGDIPRPRGVRFMKVESKIDGPDWDNEEGRMFNKYVGTDTIYIHTRCGNCGSTYKDKNTNYKCYGADEWEKSNGDKFLEHVTEEFDYTYCTHYFKAVIDKDYKKILKYLKNLFESERKEVK